MKFDLIAFMMDQFVLMFVAVVTGMILGKLLKIGTSGTLFTGLGMGWAVRKMAVETVAAGDVAGHVKAAEKLLKISVVDKMFFLLFLILFVAAVGLLAADKIGIIIKKYGAKFIILGFIITLLGAATTYGLTLMSKNASPYEVSGVYTGALTSSPGLAAAIETAREHAREWAGEYSELDDHDKGRILNILGEEGLTLENTDSLTPAQIDKFVVNAEAGVGVGHAIGYPFGVIIVIIAMRFFPLIFRLNVDEEYKKFNEEMAAAEAAGGVKEIETVTFDLTAFILACAVGYFIGKIKIFLGPLGYFGLGSTGGVLIAALVFGYIGKVGMFHFRMDKKILAAIREVGLALFLAIVGLRYGFAVIDSLTGSGLFLAFVSLMVGVVAMTIGFIVGKYFMGINWIMLSGAICGGMTSTPGLGVAIDAVGNDDPAAGYGATYPFALFGMVLFTIILHKLPM
jgi:putative transport protein